MWRTALTVITLFLRRFRAFEIPVIYAAYGGYDIRSDSPPAYMDSGYMWLDDNFDRNINLSAAEKASDMN